MSRNRISSGGTNRARDEGRPPERDGDEQQHQPRAVEERTDSAVRGTGVISAPDTPRTTAAQPSGPAWSSHACSAGTPGRSTVSATTVATARSAPRTASRSHGRGVGGLSGSGRGDPGPGRTPPTLRARPGNPVAAGATLTAMTDRLLVDFFYAQQLGHAIEALQYCVGHAAAVPGREVSVLLNAATPTELATWCPAVSRVHCPMKWT